MSLDFMQFILA